MSRTDLSHSRPDTILGLFFFRAVPLLLSLGPNLAHIGKFGIHSLAVVERGDQVPSTNILTSGLEQLIVPAAIRRRMRNELSCSQV